MKKTDVLKQRSMHTVTLLLSTTKYDHYVLEQRFYAMNHLHNVMAKHARKLLVRLEHDHEYQDALKEYISLSKLSKPSKQQKTRKSELGLILKNIRTGLGLTDYSFQAYLSVSAKRYKKQVSSQQVQKEASRVWKAVEKYLFGNGKKVHFRRYRDMDTIGGKSNLNGVRFDKETMMVSWLGMELECILPRQEKARKYVCEALSSEVSYCEIERKMFANGWHYYVIVYLKGKAPEKIESDDVPASENITGVDIGTSTVATVSDSLATLEELAPDSMKYNKRIRKLQDKMDRSRRTSNLDKYNEDGTINKSNHDKWKFSNTYLRDRDKLKSLYRQKSAYTKQSHERMCNKLIRDSVNFIVEDMDFSALQRRSKKTERQEKVSDVKKKDGTVIKIRKYKKKKRYGRSMNNRSPSMFISILERKAAQYEGNVFRVDTKKFRATQYDHSTDTYTKIPMSQRSKMINGYEVQRDLYSAYLLKNSNGELTHADREKCIYGFRQFIRLHDKLIADMKESNISMKQCFGF